MALHDTTHSAVASEGKTYAALGSITPIENLSHESYEQFEERYTRGLEFARSSALDLIEKSDDIDKVIQLTDSEWFINIETIDNILAAGKECIVYSFGIFTQDPYTDFMALKGCQVFAFDPTVDHPHEWKKNVLFYRWGIRNSAKESSTKRTSSWSHFVYGNITGSLFTIPEIMQKLGHDDGRTIAAVKFDCEGCEYSAFKDIVDYEQSSGKKFNQILALSTEFHFNINMGVEDFEDVSNIYYAKQFLESQKCKAIHYKYNQGNYEDRTILKELAQVGLTPWGCCYEYSFSCGK